MDPFIDQINARLDELERTRPGAAPQKLNSKPQAPTNGDARAQLAAVTSERNAALSAAESLQCEVDRLKAQLAAANGKQTFPATAWVPQGEIPAPLTFSEFDPNDVEGSFTRVGDALITDACSILPNGYEMPPAEVDWLRNMLEYNVKGGKGTRGIMVVKSAKLLWEHQGRTIDSETLNKMCILGWCIEWMQAWLLVADDFMDSSQTRRGKLCWYLREEVQTVALNDAFTIEMFVYKLLKRFFQDEPYYPAVVDLFMETTLQTEFGQLADTLCMNMKIQDFSVSRWSYIVKYKTAFYSFYLPVALAMVAGGVSEREAYCKARDVLIKMGVYFQAQDDYLDCFAHPDVLGKIGTDIQDKKCGWLFVHAYHELCSPEQRKLLDESYGKCKVGSDEELAIKQMYADLGLEQFYFDYEDRTKLECEAMMEDLHPAIPKTIFETFLKKIFKRKK